MMHVTMMHVTMMHVTMMHVTMILVVVVHIHLISVLLTLGNNSRLSFYKSTANIKFNTDCKISKKIILYILLFLHISKNNSMMMIDTAIVDLTNKCKNSCNGPDP